MMQRLVAQSNAEQDPTMSNFISEDADRHRRYMERKDLVFLHLESCVERVSFRLEEVILF